MNIDKHKDFRFSGWIIKANMRRISPLDAHYKWKQVVQIQTVNISNKSHPKLLNTAMYPLEMRSVKNRSTSKPLSPSWSWFVYPHPDFRLGFAKRPQKNIFYRFPKISQWDLFNKQNIFSKSHISDDQGNHLPNTTTRPKDELIAMPIGAPGAGVAKDPASNIETGPQFS